MKNGLSNVGKCRDQKVRVSTKLPGIADIARMISDDIWRDVWYRFTGMVSGMIYEASEVIPVWPDMTQNKISGDT